MSKYIFMVILSVSISIQCLRCMSTVNMIVQREENITVLCNVNSSYLMAWYRLSSERITLLISASKDNINKHFVISHNEDKGHFQLKEDNVTESISLAIIRIGEPDIGLYYCAARILGKGMQFGTPIRLTFADTKQGGFSYTADNVGCSTLLICAYAACGICGIICACVLCYRRGSSADSCISCVKKNSNSKAADMQYASLRFVRESRAAVPASVDVTYATVTSRTS